MTAVLEVEGMSKTFTRTKALSGVSMTIDAGEVHALLGQNGSGKSTLIKILSGYHAPDLGGGIRIQGQNLPFQSPVQSYRLGCRFVQQDLGLVPTLSVLDNMSLGSGFPTALGTIREKASYKQAKQDLERLSLDINPKALVATLSASERTGVAIARALREDPEYPACLLVLDEPTATLPVDEVDHLLDRVSAMAATGVGVLYVTHHLGEVFRVAHKVSVFRDGDRYFAIDDMCPHMGASLAGGFVEAGIVTCPWHYWRFRLTDGAWADNPRIKIGCYPVQVVDGEIRVELPDAPAASS